MVQQWDELQNVNVLVSGSSVFPAGVVVRIMGILLLLTVCFSAVFIWRRKYKGEKYETHLPPTCFQDFDVYALIIWCFMSVTSHVIKFIMCKYLIFNQMFHTSGANSAFILMCFCMFWINNCITVCVFRAALTVSI